MRDKKKKRWSFTRKRTNSDTVSNQSPENSTTPSWSIYQSITEISLSRWIDLDADGYLKALVKEGDPPIEELRLAEYNLRCQYADHIGNHEYKLYLNLLKDVTELEITLTQIEKLIIVMRDAYHPLLAKELNGLLKSSIPFHATDRPKIDQSLERAWRRSRGLKIALDLKTSGLSKIEAKFKTSSSKVTREYYLSLLISLSNEAGYQLTDNISVFEFCERIKITNKKVDQINLRRWQKR